MSDGGRGCQALSSKLINLPRSLSPFIIWGGRAATDSTYEPREVLYIVYTCLGSQNPSSKYSSSGGIAVIWPIFDLGDCLTWRLHSIHKHLLIQVKCSISTTYSFGETPGFPPPCPRSYPLGKGAYRVKHCTLPLTSARMVRYHPHNATFPKGKLGSKHPARTR